MRVADIMTPRILALSEADSLETARRLMEDMFIRHIPIVDRRAAWPGSSPSATFWPRPRARMKTRPSGRSCART
jgi:CBS-domain-containing membrane protein